MLFTLPMGRAYGADSAESRYDSRTPSTTYGEIMSRNEQLKAKYGITEEIYEKLLSGQGGVCAICQRHQRYKRLAVDHCHKTGQVRGLLCENCNRGIGRFFDSSLRLRNAADYIDKANRVYINWRLKSLSLTVKESKCLPAEQSVK